jgi:hypothetical protein
MRQQSNGVGNGTPRVAVAIHATTCQTPRPKTTDAAVQANADQRARAGRRLVSTVAASG